ncbi:MAG: vWA domain-containing protein [Myxococcota bacterium]
MRGAILILLVSAVNIAFAQPRDPVRDLLPEGDSDLDPIGTGDTHTLRSVQAPTPPPPDPTLGPVPPTVESTRGEVLWAIPGVREAEHRIDITLRDGLAIVDTEIRLISRARYPAEARYRIPLPADAVPVSLEVCREEHCRTARESGAAAYFDVVRAAPQEATEAPVAHLERVEDALVVRAAPIHQGAPTVLRFRWVASAPLRGGVVRFQVPARGNDLRIARAAVRITTDGLLAPSLQDQPVGHGAVFVDAWEEIRVAASAPSGGMGLEVDSFPCGEQRCGRVRAASGPLPGRPADVVLMIDVSPSTLGPARGRMAATLAALVAGMPSRSSVRAIAFAGRAETIAAEPASPSEFPLASVAQRDALGSATRFEAALAQTEGWGSNLHAIIVGDGGLTTGPGLERAQRLARRRGMRLSVVNVADRATREPLRELSKALRGVVIDAGLAADEAARGRSTRRLEEALLPIFAPRAAPRLEIQTGRDRIRLGPLMAGEELVWEGPVRGSLQATLGARRVRARRRVADDRSWIGARGSSLTTLAAIDDRDREAAPRDDCHPRGPATRFGGVSSVSAPLALAEPLTCGPAPIAIAPPPRELGRGVPRETLLQMLRGRIVPVARRCFRRDRAGRGNYATRAVFRFRLEDREIASAAIEGEISEELRSCLLGAVDTLEVPRFDGAVVVGYPLYTERAEAAPPIEIRREVLDQVDRIAGDEPSRPSLRTPQ